MTDPLQSPVYFSEEEIVIAGQLRDAGLRWTPTAGHFVLDQRGIVDRQSPFQPGVYFVLNLPYFTKIAGGADQFTQSLLWLPTWQDCRIELQRLSIDPAKILEQLRNTDALAGGTERLQLYRMLLEALQKLDREVQR